MRKKKVDCLTLGQKIMAFAFFLILFMGTALDSRDWELPFAVIVLGTIILVLGKIISIKETREN